MREVHEWSDNTGPRWSTLWQVLDRVTRTDECHAAADIANRVQTCLVHGDLSAGNLLVSDDGDLVAVIDWDGAARWPISPWIGAALCANCPPEVVTAMREATPDAAEPEHRAAIYLATWPVQHDLWRPGGHPWLSGSVLLSPNRVCEERIWVRWHLGDIVPCPRVLQGSMRMLTTVPGRTRPISSSMSCTQDREQPARCASPGTSMCTDTKRCRPAALPAARGNGPGHSRRSRTDTTLSDLVVGTAARPADRHGVPQQTPPRPQDVRADRQRDDRGRV